MKKPLIIVLCLALLVAFAAVATAEDKTQVDVYDRQEQLVKSVVFVIGQDRYFINNETPGIRMDAAPFVESGRTFVPIRYLSNALGVEDEYIGWESPKVGLNQPGMPVVQLAVGSKQIKSDSQAKTMDVAPLLKEGRTYLPARWVAEALGYQVDWDAESRVVLCYPKGTARPDVSNVISYVTGQSAEQPVGEQPTVPVGSMEELYEKAKRLDGEPFSFSDWNFDLGIQENMQYRWNLSNYNTIIQEVNVSNLKPNGINLNGVIIHNLEVAKDRITITATNPSRSIPHFYLVEESKVVRYKGGGGYMGQETGMLTYSPDEIPGGEYKPGSNPPFTPADLTKVTHVLFEFGGGLLLVENPSYKGGN